MKKLFILPIILLVSCQTVPTTKSAEASKLTDQYSKAQTALTGEDCPSPSTIPATITYGQLSTIVITDRLSLLACRQQIEALKQNSKSNATFLTSITKR
jgi:hypothetical protein